MTWDLFLIGYLFAGIIITALASIGHRSRFNRPMHWGMKVTAPVLWPLMLLLGGRK